MTGLLAAFGGAAGMSVCPRTAVVTTLATGAFGSQVNMTFNGPTATSTLAPAIE